jgi:AcrR family transcriptional regulator
MAHGRGTMKRSGRGRDGRKRRPPHGRPAVSRVPQQARGQRRVDAILDAAAAVIRESGVGGLTVHGVAERAGTSIGSMYHFFPDLEAVSGGLFDRRLQGFEPVLSALAARGKSEWSRMSAAAAVDTIVTPIFSYLRRHPDVLLLNAAPETGPRFGKRREELKYAGLEIVERILAARSPSVRPAVRRARAAVLVGAVEGVALLNHARTDQARVVGELRRAMIAYLEAVEGAR